MRMVSAHCVYWKPLGYWGSSKKQKYTRLPLLNYTDWYRPFLKVKQRRFIRDRHMLSQNSTLTGSWSITGRRIKCVPSMEFYLTTNHLFAAKLLSPGKLRAALLKLHWDCRIK